MTSKAAAPKPPRRPRFPMRGGEPGKDALAPAPAKSPANEGSAGTPTRFFGPRTIAIVLALLALNYAIATAINRPEPSVRIPYQPSFLPQVADGTAKRTTAGG